MPESPTPEANRWVAFTDRELGALLGALEAADREGSIDDVGKALLAQSDGEHRSRLLTARSRGFS